MTLGWIANIVSIIAGAMTILGLGGLITWSAFRPGVKTPLQETVLGVAAMALKFGFCLVIGVPFAMGWGAAFSMMVIMVAGMLAFPVVDLGRQPWWDAAFPAPYVVAWVVPSLVFMPLYIVAAMCLLSRSLQPARGLWRALNRRTTGTDQT